MNKVIQRPKEVILREEMNLDTCTQEHIFKLIESERGLLIGGLCLNVQNFNTALMPTVTLLTVLNGEMNGWALQKKSDNTNNFRFFTTQNMEQFPFTGEELPNVGTFFFSEVLASCCSQHTEPDILNKILNYVLSHLKNEE